ncbi:MAG: ubiquinone biosynthesis regulatory protein kinase UbiB, partial [Pseudomonadales bacterium]|nr:ubiquinone biosynthesis regulatory protein kinase UbiB [Pseudomonadales bacterium]
MPLLRVHKIASVFFHYRLDEFLPPLPLWVKAIFLLLPWRYCGRCNADLSRGERLRLALEQLGPVFVKFGQLLSTRPDLVPDDIVKELSRLQDNVPPFSAETFVSIVEKAFAQPVGEVFAGFDRQALASASVAQVHCAKLHNGREVVVKVIRPDIRQTIEHDVSLMLFLAKLAEKLFIDGRRLRAVDVVKDYRLTILDELDLQREAANASQLRRNFIETDKLYVPEVFWDYCKPSVMVMERIYGIPVTDVDALREAGINFRVLA